MVETVAVDSAHEQIGHANNRPVRLFSDPVLDAAAQFVRRLVIVGNSHDILRGQAIDPP